MRLGPFMIVLFVMYIALGLLNHTLNSNLYDYNSTGTTFLDILIKPWIWSDNPFLVLVAGAAIAIAGLTTAIGIITRSDIVTLSGLAGAFISMGAVPIMALYDFMSRNIGQFAGCIPGDTCAAASIIGALTGGILALMWVMTVMEFWLWRPVTQ